ncbi:MAG: tetratricopeptide repeat protein [Nitrospinae bacterium]|nr:tetratricopeptide repeat protein [Nitrospinota bacterium]MBL7020082.1 tetratricopeptide repeat protein [Nitrospinaceae bacterium]
MDSYFEKGIRLKGTLWVKGAVHFDGDFEGEIYSSDHFVIGKSGKILGNIKTSDVTNMGFIQGNLFAENKVALMNDSRLTGDISTYHLIIDEGSNFEGRCKMIDEPPKSVKEEMQTLERPVPKAAKVAKASRESKASNADSKSFFPVKKAVGIAVVVLVIAGVTWFYPKPGDELEPLVKKGYELIAEKKYTDAEATFKKALTFSRVESSVYAGLGDVYFEDKRYNDALAQFQRAIDLSPANGEYRIKQAKTYSLKGQLKEAVESYKQAVEIDPKSGVAFYNLGLLYLEQKDMEKALESLEMSVEWDAGSFEPHEALSRLYSQEKLYDKAVVEISEAIKLKNDNPSLHLTLGTLLLESGKEAEAVKAFKKAADLFPQNFPAQIRIADWYYTKGMLDESLETYKTAETLDSDNPLVQARLGKIYADKNENKKAQVALEKAIKLNPKDAQSHYQLGRLVSSEGKLGRAQSLLSNAIALNAGHGASHYELGLVLLGREKVDSARDEFQKALDLEPGNSDFIMGLVLALVEKKEVDKSLELLLPVSKKEANNPKVFFAICNVYTKKGYFTVATRHCEKSYELDKGNYETMNRLAWLYAKKSINLEKAFDISSQTLRAYPKRPDFIDTLSEILYVRGEPEKAMGKIKEAINLMPNNPYYKQQLWKFKNIKYKAPAG